VAILVFFLWFSLLTWIISVNSAKRFVFVMAVVLFRSVV